MLDSCEAYYKQLVASGVAEDVACDRTWDVYWQACEGGQCFDPRDRLFQRKLETIRERIVNA